MHEDKHGLEYLQHFDILTSSRLDRAVHLRLVLSPISDTFGDLLRMCWHKHRRKSILTELNLVAQSIQ